MIVIATVYFLEDLFAEHETILIALVPQRFGELWWTTVKDSNLSLALILDLGEDLVPIRSASVCACLESCDQVALFLEFK